MNLISQLGKLAAARKGVHALGREIEQRTGMSSVRCQIIAALHECPCISVNRLTKKTGIPLPTCTDVVNRMEKSGHVLKKRVARSNQWSLCLTAAGESVYQSLLSS